MRYQNVTGSQGDMKKEEFIQIIDFREEYSKEFTRINQSWFDSDFFKTHFKVEQMDRQVISDPEKYVVSKGGHIFFAKVKEQIVGTAALIASKNNSYELSKVNVLEPYRGRSISDKLIAAAIAYSRSQGKDFLWLESIRILTPAISLFNKYGFKEIPFSSNSHYDRADIKMELILK